MKKLLLSGLLLLGFAVQAQVSTQNATTINNYFNGVNSKDFKGVGSTSNSLTNKEKRKIYREYDKKRSSYGMGVGYRAIGEWQAGSLDLFLDKTYVSVFGGGKEGFTLLGAELGIAVIPRVFLFGGASQTYGEGDHYEVETDKLAFQFGLAGFVPIGKTNFSPKVFYNREYDAVGFGLSVIF